MSWLGMPSVTQTAVLIPASAASMIASAAKGGGTKTRLASAPVASTACRTVLNNGRSRWISPPFPGVTPPTTLVPYLIMSAAWNAPMRPDMPWTMTRVFSVIRMAMISPPQAASTGRAAIAACAASARVSAEISGSPDPAMIALPSATLVPASRTTTGKVSPSSR